MSHSSAVFLRLNVSKALWKYFLQQKYYLDRYFFLDKFKKWFESIFEKKIYKDRSQNVKNEIQILKNTVEVFLTP